MDSTYIMAQSELNDPNSPYYLGRPTVMQEINNYLNGRVPGYNTNYFGRNKAAFWAPQTRDTVEIIQNCKAQHQKDKILKAILIGSAAIAGLLIARKIPGLNLLVKGIGKLPSLLLKAGKGIFNLGKKIFS